MSFKKKARKTIKKSRKALKKAMKTDTAKEIVRREKLLAAEMLMKAAKKLKAEAQKKK
ncbi:hypothetical protein KY311_01680 [Candidatus Woesearchaeota archaeon]|nr:hypothetical protein [Candidatus Woesearchaeota archaeon]MBW3016932.1 hypothetical protein [Candidatus Woesearchaeota archaeon]